MEKEPEPDLTSFSRCQKACLLASVLDTVPATIGIYRSRPGLVEPLYLNQTGLRLSGVSLAEYRASMRRDPFFYIYPADRPIVAKLLCAAPPAQGLQQFTFRTLRPDGAFRWMRLFAFHLFTENGAYVYSTYCTDIDDLQRLALSERATHAKLQAALCGEKIAVWEYQVDTCTCTVQEGAEHFRRAPAAQFEQYVPKAGPLDAPSLAVLSNMHTRIAQGARKTSAELCTTNGRWLHCTYTTIFDDADSPVCAVGTALDQTDAKQREQQNERALEEALARAQQAAAEREELFARISHDMRAPLTSVLGLLELSLQHEDLPFSVQSNLAQILTITQYLSRLVADTLELSRLSVLGLALHETPVSADDFLEHLLCCVRQTAQDAGVRLLPFYSVLLGHTLCIDAFRLQQALVNLLSNAIRFTPAGGEVQFRVERLSQNAEAIRCRITVQDSGIGISDEFLPHIFEPYAREENAAFQQGGTGLGLCIVKNILDAMGGQIQIKSHKGKGTTVTLLLDLKLAAPTPGPEALQQEAPIPSLLSGRHLLLCEDDALTSNVLMRLLRRADCCVEQAENGRVGLEKFSLSPVGSFDAILMDLHMPVMDGAQAARAIRSLKRPDAASIPIVALTSGAFSDDVRVSRESGMNLHLTTPILSSALYRALNSLWEP